MDSMHIALTPRISEKSYDMANNQNVYVFEVPRTATKQEVAKGVEKQFKVSVVKVRTLVQKGKKISSQRRRKRSIDGYRATVKKAYVTVAEGDKITIFEETK